MLFLYPKTHLDFSKRQVRHMLMPKSNNYHHLKQKNQHDG
jgi:hypothetical protein